MTIKKRKMIAYFLTWITINVIGIIAILNTEMAVDKLVKIVIDANIINSIIFISFTVAKDFIKSVFYKRELDDTKKDI